MIGQMKGRILIHMLLNKRGRVHHVYHKRTATYRSGHTTILG